ncbi:hypothetical protein AIT68_004538 [Salmonella enterica subsp. salamae]|uniref:hypothetical protein n=1 Tax=Salmonella enterica TaxID=28901 RepID=UPI001E4F74EA|nr:hypothetical protein [Salmonella enterica]
MKHQRLTEAEERRLGDAIAAEARALGFVGKEKKCRRKQSAASGRGYLKPFSMNERQPENGKKRWLLVRSLKTCLRGLKSNGTKTYASEVTV